MTTRKTDADKKFEKWIKLWLTSLWYKSEYKVAKVAFHAGYLAGICDGKKNSKMKGRK